MNKLKILILIFLINSINAQFYFGRNKIQFNQFNWNVLETEHFQIYYYEQEKELALAGAKYVEDAYKDISKKINFSLIDPVPLIFYSSHLHFQQTNTINRLLPEGVGGFFEFIKGRVVIPYSGDNTQFRNVIKHELIHVLMHQKINKSLSLHNVQTYRSPPLWFTEGIAEYWSSVWDARTEMVIRDAIVNEYLGSLDNYSSMASGFLLYKAGQSFFRFVDENYGEWKILEILENMWRFTDFNLLLEYTFNKSFPVLMKEWKYFYKKQMYPILEDYDSPSSISNQITSRGINVSPVINIEDNEIYFLTNRMGYSDVYSKTLTTEHNSALVLKGERTANLESLHLLNSNLDIHEGELLVSAKSGSSDAINIVDVETKKIKNSLKFSNIVSISSPKWNFDKTKIVFSASSWNGNKDIYLYDLENKLLNQLTNDYFYDLNPIFSPDGEIVLFESDRGEFGFDGYTNLFLFRLDDQKIFQLTSGKFKDSHPNWSKKNNDILFSSDRDGSVNIWKIDSVEVDKIYQSFENNKFQKFSVTRHTNSISNAIEAQWADKDSKKIIFTSFENYSFQIYSINNIEEKIFNKIEIDPVNDEFNSWERKYYNVEKIKNIPSYKKKFTLDISQTSIAYDQTFGLLGGAQFALSDVLGNHHYNFLLFNTSETSSDLLSRMNFAVSKIDLSKRVNIGYGIFHFAGDYYNFSNGYFFEKRQGVQLSLSYPFSIFKRIELMNSLIDSERDSYIEDYYFDGFLFSNSFSYVFDNSIWGSLGPVDGTAYRISVNQSYDILKNKLHSTGISTDIRKYFRLSFRTLYAVRLMTSIRTGQSHFNSYIGGSWGLRGYYRRSVSGTSFFMLNNELRFPFADHLVMRFGSRNIGFAPIRSALFLDFGNAWDDKLDDILGSAGIGFRGNFLGGLVLRLDIGRTFDLSNNWGDTFTQFFFGWNY